MFIAVAAYQIAYRGMGAAAANDCSQNKTQQIVFVLHYIYYICRVIYKLWQTYKKNTERESSSPANLPICFCACLSLPVAWCPSYFNHGVNVIMFPLHLRSPCQYHVCVLPQWRTLHGISVLLYILGIFSSDIINYHSSHRVFSSSKISKNTCAREKFQPEQQKIRSPVTKNPPSRNRTPRFASPPKTVHRPLPRRQPLCPFGHADVSPWPQPRSGLMSLCSYVLLFPALAASELPLRRQPLCLLRPPGRQSVAVSRAAALCVSYVNLCHLCFPR